jgi:uncharacterized delta-60 repeat protein
MKKILLSFTIICICVTCSAQAGYLDPLYGNNGIQRTIFFKGNVQSESGKKVLQQADGKILALFVLSSGQGVIARYLSNGKLDPTYGTGGFSQFLNMSLENALLQPDGKVVAVGYTFNDIDGDFAVARVKTNGFIDNSFGTNGMQITDFGDYDLAFGVAIQTNGKIVVAGASAENFALARYNANGTPDMTFDFDGKQTTDFGRFETANGVAIQPDGKIVVAGSTGGSFPVAQNDFAVARYTTSGTLDNTFSGDGKQTTDFGLGVDDYGQTVLIQPDGKIVVAGTAFESGEIAANGNFAVARYTTTGSHDNSFSGDGKASIDLYGDHDAAFSAALQPNGKIVLGGLTIVGADRNFGLARLNTNGTLDMTFSGDGKQQSSFGTDDLAYSVLIQKDAKIFLAGEAFNDSDYDLGLARYNSDGSPDKTFDLDGLDLTFFPSDVPLIFASAAVQADGKLLAAGYVQHKVAGSPGNMDFAVARYLPNGSLDNTFNGSGKLTVNFGYSDAASAISVLSDGKILIAGTSNGRSIIARYKSDGTPDHTFNASGRIITYMGPSGFITSMALQDDGKIVVGGGVAGNFAVMRHLPSGPLDNSFNGDGIQISDFDADDRVNAVAIQKDGKIVAAGVSFVDGFIAYFAVARYTSNGAHDNSFSGDGKQSRDFLLGGLQNDASALAIQGDGKILVAGSLRTETENTFLVARYKTDGNLDNSYNGDGLFPIIISGQDEGKSIILQVDGKAIIGGSSFGGARFALVRCKVDGTLDPGFGVCGKQQTNMSPTQGGINQLAIFQHRLYAAGNYEFVPLHGLTAAYQLGSFAVTLSCPSSRTVQPDPGKCAATVKSIDAVVTPSTGNFTIKYNLTGATVGSGTGTASNRLFNHGKTTVTYKIAEALEKTCSFSVTVNCAVASQSVVENVTGLLVDVLPNPSLNHFTVNTRSNSIETVLLRVTDVLGRVVEQRNAASNSSVTIGHSYRAGIYFIQVQQGNERRLLKCIKRN